VTRWGKAQEGYTLTNHLGYSVSLSAENRRFIRPVPAPHTLVTNGGQKPAQGSTLDVEYRIATQRGGVQLPAQPSGWQQLRVRIDCAPGRRRSKNKRTCLPAGSTP